MILKNTILKQLNIQSVDTRYVSIYKDTLHINNYKFAKFTKKKQEKFNQKYPEIKIIQSKIFQKICNKTSKNLKTQIKPRDIIYVNKDNRPENIALQIILEPYQRKYGIKITDNINEKTKIANSQTLDQTTHTYIEQMLNGEKIQDIQEKNTIYPLKNIPIQWVMEWLMKTSICYQEDKYLKNDLEDSLISFLEIHVPNVKENILRSVEYLEKN
ncbi:MAG: ATPase [Methanobacteriaceae archaeon]|nr:ATPase [Methanobacteriaceae archaeon]